MASDAATPLPATGLTVRSVWRWHFYASLLCMPFVLWLALTGSLYLFKPQVEAWLDAPVDRQVSDQPARPASEQVTAALAAVAGARFSAYELPRPAASASRVLLTRDAERYRVYVDPGSARVLQVLREDGRLMPTISRLHGELLIGNAGSMLVELAASWAIVMILTGLYLWWPRGARGLAGVLYPRLRSGGRVFWRDLHASAGWWIALLTLFLLLSGLPWAKFWGGNLKALRAAIAQHQVTQDWTTSHAEVLAQRRAEGGERHGGAHAAPVPYELAALDRLLPLVAARGLAPPVLIAPPDAKHPQWLARSDAQNRPLRVTLTLDAERNGVVREEGFAQKPFLDRLIGQSIAIHEGQRFGWLNQALGLFTALGLITVTISGAVMWWRRRPAGLLGAPPPDALPRPLGWTLRGAIVLLGLLLPLLGASLLLVLLIEAGLLRRWPAARRFLGLSPA